MNHQIGYRISVLFMRITGFADPAWQSSAPSLLNDVGSFVRGSVKRRGLGEDHIVTGGIGLGTDLRGRFLSGATGVSAQTADVVMAKRCLNLREVW